MPLVVRYGTVETPDAQAAWEQWPVSFADPPASPDPSEVDAQERAHAEQLEDAQERASRKAAVTPPANQREAEPVTVTAEDGSSQAANQGGSSARRGNHFWEWPQ